MVIGYYDGQGYDDLIPGSASTQTADVDQAIASGGDSSNPNPPGSEEHYEDYSRPEDSSPTLLTDDYITQARTAHGDNCIADYMDTSKSTRDNYYGWSWSTDMGPSFISYVNQQNPSYNPSYQQYYMGTTLTWGVLTTEIDNDRPMIFLVDTDADGSTDHSVTVVGYRDTPSQQYGCLDTWPPPDVVRWCDFTQMSGGQPWGIWSGWSFSPGPMPVRVAHYPDPCDGAVDVPPGAVLSWRPGICAAGPGAHDVYLGTDFGLVNAAGTSSDEYRCTLALEANSYDPCDFEFASTYYWRIDEHNDTNSWKGDIWSFTVTEYIIIDDMESYNSGNEIRDTWLDIYHNWSGSSLELWVDPCEPVHAGRQSMKYDYDSSGGLWGDLHYYSEARRTITDPCDWTASGAKVLTLYFYGHPDNDANATEQMYVGLEDSSGSASYVEVKYGDYGEDGNDVKAAEWQEWNIELEDFNDGGVDLTDVNRVYIGFGIRSNLYPGGTPGGSGVVYFDDIRLYPPKCVPSFAKPIADFSSDCLVNFDDFTVLGNQWMEAPGSPSADIAPEVPDGVVDWLDLDAFVGAWLREELWPSQ
ncbi:MAG: hypothetical protein ACYS9T_03485 [Planctomycetota bacterium]|jgi:hypothetical protein